MSASEPTATGAARARTRIARPVPKEIQDPADYRDPQGRDFALGWNAFCDSLAILDNPHFAEADQVRQFDAWQDGWLSAKDAALPKRHRLLTALQKTHAHRVRMSLRGVTATWAVGAVR